MKKLAPTRRAPSTDAVWRPRTSTSHSRYRVSDARKAAGTSASGSTESDETIGIEPPRSRGTRFRRTRGRRPTRVPSRRKRTCFSVRRSVGRRARTTSRAAASAAPDAIQMICTRSRAFTACGRVAARHLRSTRRLSRREAARPGTNGSQAGVRRMRLGNVKTRARRRAGNSARAASSSRTAARNRPSTGGTGVEREDERDREREAREDERLPRRRGGPGRREARGQEREAHGEEEEVAPVPGGHRDVSERLERVAPEHGQLGRTLGEPARRIAGISRLVAVHEEQQVADLQPGRNRGFTDAAHAKALRLGRNEHVGPAESRDLTREAKRGRYEREREGAQHEPTREGAQADRPRLHAWSRSKEDASNPVP